MKFKIKMKKIILIICNVLCIIGIVTLNMISVNIIDEMSSQNGAENWKSSTDKMDYSQVSCFFSKDAMADKNTVDMIRNTVNLKLTDASIDIQGKNRVWIDAYTKNCGQFSVSAKKQTKNMTEITSVNSDFFLIHSFDFISGSYFLEDDIAENSIVIDSYLAWQCFGSDDVVGMELFVENTLFYVSGVVDLPSSKDEKKCYSEYSKAYIPFKITDKLLGEENLSIDSYEAVIPNPVVNFGYKIISETIEGSFQDNALTVQNTERFSFSNRAKKIKSIAYSVIVDKPIIYPWWENSARVVEMKVTINYFIMILLAIFPLVTLVRVLIKVWRYIKRKHILKSAFSKVIEKIKRNRMIKNNKEQNTKNLNGETKWKIKK